MAIGVHHNLADRSGERLLSQAGCDGSFLEHDDAGGYKPLN
jgi:hypothetical protein